MARHRKSIIQFPAWVEALPESCLRTSAEDAYYAKMLADKYGADQKPNCATRYKAGTKELTFMANSRTAESARCFSGDRAARKFWEAKVCARGGKLGD